MQVSIFQSSENGYMSAVTPDEGGSNLPPRFGPWKLIAGAFMRKGDNLGGTIGGFDAVMVALERDGFCLIRSTVPLIHPSAQIGS